MCTLCIEVAKGKMTFKEVGRALAEFTIPEEHLPEFNKVLEDVYTPEELQTDNYGYEDWYWG